MRKLTDTVWSFLDRAGAEYAKWCEEGFRQEMHANCVDCGMESPIEDLFWIAMFVLCKAEYEPFNPHPNEDQSFPHGVYVRPQVRVGNFRVDFEIVREPRIEGQRCSPVIVELDGHDFHDKDKRQRAYEKSRDRFLVKRGYRVLHFTGSEIVADPFKAAHEVMVLLNAASWPEYDPTNVLGVD